MHTLNKISEAEIERLNYERYNYPSALVQKRLHVVYLKATLNYQHLEIAKIVGVHPNTVTTNIKRYASEGIVGLTKVNYGTNHSLLDQHEVSIKELFEKHPPTSVKEARQRIKELTGIERSPTQIRAFMKRMDMKFVKVGHIPAKADTEAQKQWLEDKLEPALELAKQGEAHVLFMDAAHFVLQPFLCFLWCFKRLFIKAPAGRKRVNVLGAVNALTKEVYFIVNQSRINAEVIVDFLHQLRIYYYDMKPIYIVLDNARYQHCQLVRYIAWQFNIHLLFLPPYSPNLNIIERLWKFVKKKCLYAKYYATFDEFKAAIVETMKKTNTDVDYVNELRSLLTLKFQLFDKSRLM